MDEAEIRRAVTEMFEGVDVQLASAENGAPELAWGDSFFFYNPPGEEPDRRMPFATIVTKDYGDFDRFSDLDRPGVFRLNVGVGPETYRELFGPHPAQPEAGQSVATGHDFTALDTILPHPIYAPMSWISVLSPSAATFERLRPYLTEAYERAVKRRGGGGA